MRSLQQEVEMNYKWIQLREEMAATGKFYLPRLTARILCINYHAGRAVVRFRPEYALPTVYTYITWLKTKDQNWVEIALGYVASDKGGNGVLREIFGELLDKLPDHPGFEDWERFPKPPQAKSFLIARYDTSMWHMALRFGYRPITKFQMPNVVEWSKRVGMPEDRLPESATCDNPHHDKSDQRWLMVRMYEMDARG